MPFRRSHTSASDPDFNRVKLPEGVSEERWNVERDRWQNPRLRALLGSLRLITTAQESNTAILNASPKRLESMWRIVREVADAVRRDLGPVIGFPSVIPELESAREAVAANLAHLELTLLAQIQDLPAHPAEADYDELRRFLCVAIGQLHGFLQDSFGSLMANDPRGRFDADYYLSKEFPRDVEESEWLFTSVTDFDGDVRHVEKERQQLFPRFLEQVAGLRRLPEPHDWAPIESFLRFLSEDFTLSIRKIMSLRAIRLTELELLSHHASEIPVSCRVLLELYESGRLSVNALAAFDTLDGSQAADPPHAGVVSATISSRLLQHARGLDDALRDLGAFIPLWRQGISQRRALAFRFSGGNRSA